MLAGGGLGNEAPTVGHMQIAKPGRMRWHYREPRESLVLSDGETLWIYDAQAREVTRARVSEGYLAGAALQFLLGEGAIADAFDVVLERCDASGVHLTLTPKEPASYEKLGLVVDGDTGIVRGTTIYDLFGNVTRLRFEDVRFDRSPPAETFIWSESDDVRVIDLESGGGAARGGSSGGSAEQARPSSW
jgi:outer membrane lipoprotein carrier protein